MDNEVKPTWRLAWGLWWRWVLIGLGVGLVIWLIMFILGAGFISWLWPW
jgi:hypothetical protein